MIHIAMISRVSDGLPLCATTDVPSGDQSSGPQEAYRQMKQLTKNAARCPDRCSYSVDQFTIHFITALDLCFLVLCDASYPPVLAFSFLNQIQKDFLVDFERKKVDLVARPYGLIEFGSIIQKAKNQYNNPRSLTARLDLSALSQELRLRPPHQVSLDELQYQNNNQFQAARSPDVFSTAASLQSRYLPLGLLGLVAIGLNCFCAFLNLTRGVSVINDAHIDDFDHNIYQYGAAFIACCFLSLYQVCLICFPLKKSRALGSATLASICLCQLYLWEYRNNFQIVFHVTVACIGTFVIFTRKNQNKLPQYTL